MQYKIIQDEWGEHNDPRQWDNLGTMVCWHRNYSLGDEQPRYSLGVWLSYMLAEHGIERIDQNGYLTEQWEDFIYDLENDDLDSINKAWQLLDGRIFYLPLYLYDHSGITMSTRPFSCPWDSGQVGLIYVSKDDIRSEWGKQRISKKLEDLVYRNLKAEVETYDQYLRGDIWGYIIEDRYGDIVDSCWGFFGYDYCEQEGKAALQYFQELENEELIRLQSGNRELTVN